MIPASLYQTIYLIIITIISLVVFMQYQKRRGEIFYRHKGSDVFSIILLTCLVLFIGMRPISAKYFTDTANYVVYYNSMFDGARFYLDLNTENKIFDNLFSWWGSEQLGYNSFFFLITTIYFVCSYIGVKRLFPNHILAAYLVFLAAFSTFSYATNGIKAGAATSLFILALGYRENLKICIPLVLVSWGFHHSMIMVVAALLVTLFVKNPKIYFIAWFFCFLLAAAHISFFADFFSRFTTEHGADYLLSNGSDDGTKGGFRIDFIMYSAVPVVVGWYAIFKKGVKLSNLYKSLLNLYLCLNGIWMLCMYASYTNRIAYLSWFIYPIVLIYPFLQEDWGKNRYRTFSIVMLGHLGFTLFMNLVYYS